MIKSKRYVEDLPTGELEVVLWHLTKGDYSSLTDEKQWLLKIVAKELEKRSKINASEEVING
jgi:hypothetical protein